MGCAHKFHALFTWTPVSFTSRPFYTQGNSTRYPLNTRLGGLHSRSGCLREEKTPCWEKSGLPGQQGLCHWVSWCRLSRRLKVLCSQRRMTCTAWSQIFGNYPRNQTVSPLSRTDLIPQPYRSPWKLHTSHIKNISPVRFRSSIQSSAY